MVSITVSEESLAWKVFSIMVRQCQATVLTVRDVALFPTPDLVGAVGSDGLGLIYQHGYTIQRQSVVNLDLQYKLKLDFITKGLDFRIKGSYNSDYTQQKARTTAGGISYKATVAKGEYEEDGSPKVVYVRQGDSWPLGYEEEKWGGRNWYAEASLNYARKFGDHNFGALVLYNESKNYYPGGVYNSIPRGYVGMVGRVTYDYQTKYMIDLNMGYNGSENFAKGKRLLFPFCFSRLDHLF